MVIACRTADVVEARLRLDPVGPEEGGAVPCVHLAEGVDYTNGMHAWLDDRWTEADAGWVTVRLTGLTDAQVFDSVPADWVRLNG